MTIHGTAPGPGRWPPWGSTVRADLPGPCRGAEATVEPAGRGWRFDRVTGGAGFPDGVDSWASGFDRRAGGAAVAEKRQRARAGHPADRQAVCALELPDRSVGERAITPIDRTGRIAGRPQAALKRTHEVRAARSIACAWPQADDRPAQRCPCPRTDDAVHLEAVRRLERNHRLSRARSIQPIDAGRRVTRQRQTKLCDSHQRRALRASVPTAQDQQRIAKAGAGIARWPPADAVCVGLRVRCTRLSSQRRCRESQREHTDRQRQPRCSSVLLRGVKTRYV